MAIGLHPKPSVHHRKKRGAHHRHDKKYLKAYSPYLPLLLLVIVGLAVNAFWVRQEAVLGANTNLSANQLLQDTNLERSRKQLNDLTVNRKLSAAAQAKANDMVQQNYWSHTSPSGKSPWVFVENSGYEYQSAGENLAYGFVNSASTITGWMNSEQHRKNLLNGNFSEVGFGITLSDDFMGKGPATIVVAMYGEPQTSAYGMTLGGSADFSSATTTQPFKNISRVQLLTGGQAPWSFTLLSLLTFFGLAVFVLRHGFAWHRVLVKSEEFVLRHKFLDFVVISLAVAGFVLTRTIGFIY